jgi:hypothetical protein
MQAEECRGKAPSIFPEGEGNGEDYCEVFFCCSDLFVADVEDKIFGFVLKYRPSVWERNKRVRLF